MSHSRELDTPAWLETLPRYVVWVREHFSDDGEFRYMGLVAEEHPEGIYVKYADVLAACPPQHVELAQDRAPGSAAATLRINPEVGQGSAAHSTSPLLAASPPPAEARDWQPISDVQPQDGQDYPVTAERAGEFVKEPSR